ncbi:hypothetical protein ACFYZ8_13370 [Streptomyces sp. NPDC001668]|uniref:hypothetical protein n=1 Tax=unclassified Streptomyces TaxID=2593676 RepID=UPI0033DDF858
MHVDEESLYVAVQSIVDGPVEVAVYRRDAPKDVVEGLVQAFSGVFGSRSGKIRIQDSDGKAVLTFGRRGEGGLVVLVDELNWAARVVLVVG